MGQSSVLSSVLSSVRSVDHSANHSWNHSVKLSKTKPVVAHLIQDYLRHTTNWIYGQIVANHEFEHLVLAKRVLNLDQFKVKKIVALQTLPRLTRFWNEIIYRLFGHQPAFVRACQREKVALIHAHFGHIGFKAIGLKQKLGVPLVTTFYGYDVSALGRIPSYRRRFEKLFQKGDLFLAEGPCLSAALVALGCPQEKIRVFHLGVHVDQYEFQARPDHKQIRILFAATLTEKKGWSFAVKAFARAAKLNPDIRLRLIGEGEDEAALTQLIEKLGIGPRVERSGYVKHDQLIEEMLRADVFLQPSQTAKNGNTEGGAPVTLIDAQATGLAICATFHADIPEVSPHNVSALLSPENEIEFLSENLIRLCADHALRTRLGAAGRKRVEQDYNWKIQGERESQLYSSLLNQ